MDDKLPLVDHEAEVAAILAMSADDLRAAPIAVIAPEDERCTNCMGCTNCTCCKCCKDCTCCMGCKDCTGCTDCVYCMYCTGCCTYCYKTSGVRNAHYLVLGVQLTADQYAAVMATVQD